MGPHTDLGEAMFRVYLRDFSETIIRVVGAVTITLLLFSIVFTQFFAHLFDPVASQHHDVYVEWRFFLCLFLGWMVLALTLSDWIKKWTNLFFSIAFLGATFITSIYIMPVKMPNETLRYLVYIIPFFTIIAPAPLMKRAFMTFGSLIILPGTYLGLGWQPYLYTPLFTIITGISAVSTAIGHFCYYKLNREKFFQNRMLEKRQRELEEAKLKAEESDRNKSLFLANVSHDVRTPLNSILGYSEMLKNEVDEPDKNRKIETVYSAANDLKNLIDTLIDVSRIELNEYDFEKSAVDLPVFVETIKKLFDRKASNQNIEFRTTIDDSVDELVNLDERAVKQVLYNLLDNAFKYTQEGSVILRIHANPTSNKPKEIDLTFEVEDTGRGIPKDQLETIFEIFDQGSNHDTEGIDGFGLGLYICNELTRAMDGTLEVESEPGEGSVFRVNLSDVSVVENEYDRSRNSPDKIADNVDFQNATGLVIDDDQHNRRILIDYLDELGLSGIQSSNGQDGVNKARDQRPDVILLDIRMDGMDGYETFLKLNEHEDSNSIPVIAITAHATSNELDKIERHDFDGVLTKPINLSDLTRELMDHLNYEEEADPSTDGTRSSSLEVNADHIPDDASKTVLRETLDLYDQSLRTRNVNTIRKFAKKIKRITTGNKNDPLLEYSRQLLEAVDKMELARINSLLETFDELVVPIKEQLN